MGSVVFECPQCGGSMEADQEGLRGRLVVCPHCEAQIQVPGPEGEEDAPADGAEGEAPAAAAVQPGKVIRSIYKVEEKLGESSLGEVYTATVVTDGRKVQLEILQNADQESVDRLSREIELLASLQHENIVHAFDAGQDGDLFFLASDYEEGNTLEKHLKEGAIDEGPAIEIARGIAKALQYAWDQRKILHRDIKPPNIFITDSGTAKLMGFGIAKSSEGQSMGLTGVGFTIGTPEYMSPEQIKADETLDFRSDMYALGCVLYEMVTGGLPFQEDAPILLMQKHMDEDPEPTNIRNPNTSAETAALVAWMMQKDRDARPAEWQELIGQMDAILAGTAEAAPAASNDDAVSPQPKKRRKKKKKSGCMGVFAAVAGFGFAGVYLLTKLLAG